MAGVSVGSQTFANHVFHLPQDDSLASRYTITNLQNVSVRHNKKRMAFPGETRVHSLRKQLIFKSTQRAIAHSIFCSSSHGKSRAWKVNEENQRGDDAQRSMLAVRLAAKEKAAGASRRCRPSIIWHFIRLNQRPVQKQKAQSYICLIFVCLALTTEHSHAGQKNGLGRTLTMIGSRTGNNNQIKSIFTFPDGIYI